MNENIKDEIRDRIEVTCSQLERKRSSALCGRARSGSKNFRGWFMLLFRDLVRLCTQLISPTDFWATFGVREGEIETNPHKGFEAIYKIFNEHPDVLRDLQSKCGPVPIPGSAVGYLVASEKASGRVLEIDECIALLRKLKKLRATP